MGIRSDLWQLIAASFCFNKSTEKSLLKNRPQLGIEQLEPRKLLSVSRVQISSLAPTLIIEGSNLDDVVTVSENVPNVLTVSYECNGQQMTDTFDKSLVDKIVFQGLDGNDQFTNQTDLPTIAYGHAGTDILTGGSGADELWGGTGDDTLTGGAGADTIRGEEGADLILGQGGRDILDGGLDEDQIYGGIGDDTIYGREANDLLYGEDGNDIVSGNEGNDILEGGDGNDILDGDSGNDTLRGDDGVDTLRGEDGNDLLVGGLGDDTLIGGEHSDQLYGGGDNDFLHGEGGNDLLFGEAGDDVVYGDAGDDILDGDDGDDTLEGGDGNDVLRGDAGADILRGEGGQDQLEGGAGDDSLIGGFDNDTLIGGDDADQLRGGDGNDILEGNGGNDDLFGDNGDDDLKGGLGDDQLWGGQEDDILNGAFGADTLRGEAGNDTLLGGSENDMLIGGDGNDSLTGSTGDDSLFGGLGDDTLYGNTGIDILDGDAGNDVLYGGTGDDDLFGDLGNDEIYGHDGIDNLRGGDGSDTLRGGDGNDTLSGQQGVDTLFGEAGDDTLDGGSENDTLEGQAGIDTLLGGDGDDLLRGGTENDILSGQAGFDSLLGGDGDDILDGGTEDDSLFGHNGNDTLRGGEGNDLLYGQLGNDYLEGQNGNDSLYGHDGVDQLHGGDGNDVLSGAAENDTLTGGAGNDTVIGGTGDDTIDGGLGNDTLRGDAGDDTIDGSDGDDLLIGNDGNDTLNGGAGADNIIAGDGNDVANGNADNDVIQGGAGNDTLNGQSGDDALSGGDGNDIISGQQGNDLLQGSFGADTLYGNDGNDEIYGGDDFDVVYGGADDDQISGGDGNDLLHGEAGDDTISGNNGHDTITGGTENDQLFGNEGRDTLQGLSGDDLIYGAEGDDTILGGTGDDMIFGEGGDDYIEGAVGNDLLSGGDGADDLQAGDGQDVLIGGDAIDVLNGSAGEDLLIGGIVDHSFADLDALLSVWSGPLDYASRILAIEDSSFSGYLESHATVMDDYVPDSVSGSDGKDWFFKPGVLGIYDAASTGGGTHGGGGQHQGPVILQNAPVVEGFALIDSLDHLEDKSADEALHTLIPHGDDAVKQKEHLALFELVKYDQVTHTAMQNGDWSNPSTWANGIVPSANARVLIPVGVEVTVDGVISTEFFSVRIDGTLAFATNVDTELRADTIIGSAASTLRMGTSTQPIEPNVTARMVFTDNGAIDRVYDPFGISRGLITRGSVEVHGTEVTPYHEIAGNALSNQAAIRLSAIPTDWNVGDEIVIAGTSSDAIEDETRTITAIFGDLVFLSTRLVYDHVAPTPELSIHVANLTRNVVFESEGTDIDRRGHTMFMHNRDVHVANAAFNSLGRTDKSVWIDDSVVDENWQLVAGTGTNQRARYSVHFHRNGTLADGNPSTVVGSVVNDSPGWGFTNHSSYVDFTGNVSVNVNGAGFATEVGDETGTFSNNISLSNTGSGENDNDRIDVQDFGHTGAGFWFQGAGITVVDNIATSSEGSGFIFYTRGLIEGSNGLPAHYLTANLTDPSIAQGAETILVDHVPVKEFQRNEAYGSSIGFTIRYHLREVTHNGWSTFENSTFWNNEVGMDIPYTMQTNLRDIVIKRDISGVDSSMGINSNPVTADILYDNLTIIGYNLGIVAPRSGASIIQGGTFQNRIAIVVRPAIEANSEIRVEGPITFVPLPQAYAHPGQWEVEMRFITAPYQSSTNYLYLPRTTILNYGPHSNRLMYFSEQAADAIPFPVATAGIPPAYIGLTTQQLSDLYGLLPSNMFAPTGVVTDPDFIGLLDP